MRWQFWVGLIISALFLYLSFHKIDFGELGASIVRANYIYLIPAVLITIVSFWIRSYRWKFLLKSVKDIAMSNLFSATMIGFMANNLLPVRLGEFVRADAIGRKEKISKSASFATIVVERLLDGLTLLLFLIAVLLFFHFPRWVRTGGLLAFLFYIFILAFLLFLKMRTDQTLRWIGILLKLLPASISPKVEELLLSFIDGLKILSDGRRLLIVSLLSILLWLTAIFSIECVFYAFNFDLPLYAAFILLVVISFGVMLPSSPGFVGTFQYSCVVSLALFRIPKEEALSFSVILHASNFIPVTVVGLFYFWREHLSFKQIAHSDID